MRSLADARAWLAEYTPRLPGEHVPLAGAAGRILAADLHTADQPPWPVAAINGQAVRAADTEGASDYAPLPLTGSPVEAGAQLPTGADAVLAPVDVWNGFAQAPVAAGSGIVPCGHDAPAGLLLRAGTFLRPLHLALLETDAEVVRRPRAHCRAFGPAAHAGRMLALLHALTASAGAVPVAEGADLVVMAGRFGRERDADAMHAFTTADPSCIAICPGGESVLGMVGATPALLLPGTPADCATAFALLAAPALRRMGGLAEPQPTAATLTRKIISVLGQVDAVRVRLEGGQATPLGPAEGIGLLAAAGANGLVLVPEGSEGYPAGATVPIFLL